MNNFIQNSIKNKRLFKKIGQKIILLAPCVGNGIHMFKYILWRTLSYRGSNVIRILVKTRQSTAIYP
jgi:hypothetical protein